MERLWSLLLGISQTSIYRQSCMCICKANRILHVEATNCTFYASGNWMRAVLVIGFTTLISSGMINVRHDEKKDFAISDFFEICSVRFNEIFSGMKNCSSCRWRSTYSHIISVVADVRFYKVGHGTVLLHNIYQCYTL